MFVYRVDDFLGSGADFLALLGFCPLHRALGVAFGLGLGSGRVPLSDLLGRAVASGLLSSDGILHSRCLRAHRNSLFGALKFGSRRGGMGPRGLGIGDGLHTVGFFALLGVGLFELPLGGQRIVAGHGAGNLFRLTLDRVDQTLTCLVSLVVLSHLSLLFDSFAPAPGSGRVASRRGARREAGVIVSLRWCRCAA